MQAIRKAFCGRLVAAGAAALVAATMGCGGQRTVPIQAVFLYDGEPLADAGVSFVRVADSESPGRPAFGSTDSEGRAALTTYERNDGVPPGEYRVVVLKPPKQVAVQQAPEVNDLQSMVRASSMAYAGPSARPDHRRTVLPEVYADPGKTPLTCTVVPGQLEHRFELSSSP